MSLITKRWRKRQSLLPSEIKATSAQHTPIPHHRPSPSLHIYKPSPRSHPQSDASVRSSVPFPSGEGPSKDTSPSHDVLCQSSTALEGQTARAKTVHDFLESLYPQPRRPGKRKGKITHTSKRNAPQHSPTLPPLVLEDPNYTPIPKPWSKSRPRLSNINPKKRCRPSPNTPAVNSFPLSSSSTNLPRSDDKLPIDSSGLRPLSSWKEKIEVTPSAASEPPKKGEELSCKKFVSQERKKRSKKTTQSQSKRRPAVRERSLVLLKQLELTDLNDSSSQSRLGYGTPNWSTHSSNIGCFQSKAASKLTAIHQTAQWLTPSVELSIECSPTESEPITSSPPRLRHSARLPSMADSIICSPKASRPKRMKPKVGRRSADDVKTHDHEWLRTLDLRSLSMDEDDIEISDSTQSHVRPRRLDLELLSTPQSLASPDATEEESLRQPNLLSPVLHQPSARDTKSPSKSHPCFKKKPSFSAEEILEKLLPVASQVSNAPRLENALVKHVTLEPPSTCSSDQIDRYALQPFSCRQQRCHSSSIVLRTKSILRNCSSSASKPAGNSVVGSKRLRRRMTVMFDDRQTFFESPSSNPWMVQRTLSQIILPPSSLTIPTSASNNSFSSSPVQVNKRKSVRKLSDLPRSFSNAISSSLAA